MHVTGTSGDLLADRRYAYAQGAFEEGDFAAAADLARQVLDLAPDFAAALALLGRAAAALGESDEAAASLTKALGLDPDDPLGVRVDLAHLGLIDPDEALSPAYIRALFDDYAPRFERHLVRRLEYRGPDLLADALRRAALLRFRPPAFGLALDLGCGTGLMAKALDGMVERIEGIDLSPRMLVQARKTHLYAALHEADLAAFLAVRDRGEADLVVAADVFVYLADLGAVFGQAARVLAKGGFLAFTVQAHEGDGVRLGRDARYAHGRPYLEALATQAALRPVLFESVSTRQDRGEPVPGFLLVLER